MKNRKMVFLLCAAFGSVAFASIAQAENFYVQIDGGAAFLGDTDLVGGGELQYDAGWAGGVRLGGKVGDALRLEIDASYAENEVDEVNGIALSAFGLDADVQVFTFGIGAYTDFHGLGGFTPYLGAGIGGAYKEIDTNFGADDDATDLYAHGDLGMELAINSQFSFVPHYRLVWFDEFGDDEQFAHWLRLGLRFSS